MRRLLNEQANFREEMIDGFLGAYGRYARRVPRAAGVAALGAPRPGLVSVVIGGGSGQYPAFYGLVGEGFASAAVNGDVFTSPSGEEAYRVGKAVDGGAGILWSFGNYSGDVLNFGMAAERLAAEGIPSRTVLVTDDVLSAPRAEADRRRGIAGGFYVYKIAAAAAARGDDLSAVEAVTRRANARTTTAGVAFAGCTLPGQAEPLFTVDPDKMEVGLGIHGEPGVRQAERLPAREVAAILVETLLAEAPADAGGQAAVLVNGLGGTKYEELFVLSHGIMPLLAAAGIEPYRPLVGEFVTSLEMAGCSLTLCWLDDELQSLLDATAITPAFTQVGPDSARAAAPPAAGAATLRTTAAATTADGDADPGGRAGEQARAALRAAAAAIAEREAELGRLDAAAGDGDHGAGMCRGFRAAVAAIDGFPGTARQSFRRAGTAFQNAAGGASGALVGGWLLAIGDALPAGDDAVTAASLAEALAAGLAAVQRLGGAEPGDKTLVDTLHPFGQALTAAVAAGAPLADAWAGALAAGEAGMRATSELVSKRGRASRLGERSRGFADAGATSIFYVLRAFGEAWAE